MAPIASVVTIKHAYAPDPVLRYNGHTAADLAGEADPCLFSSTEAMSKVAQLAQQVLPPGIEIEWLEGRAHSAGWLTRIPANLQDDLGGDYITGFSSVYAIDSRNSIGPTAFVTNMSDILTAETDSIIPATPLMDFSLSHPITDKHDYNYLDKSASHCAGPCPFYTWDSYNYAWLFDVQDLIDVKNGLKSPNEVQPYSYGKIPIKFEDPDSDGVNSLFGSADYDPGNQLLYITLIHGDRIQNVYDPVPLVVVYKYILNRPHSPTDLTAM